ncbi:hypothetical protein IM816_05285 [Luteibacter flocculans]|uniref:Uncharacterized protein n=1 Tax=Luteibacter flocculans TaxID=2780091 RepID=A0ABY4T3P2_9GAMM|nr:hypothetical protein [Luteibacter flocculans]URL59519.1 hypothetical protein IM816_05285 [Luteibacter flocculans]
MNHSAKALLLVASTALMPAIALASTTPASMCAKSDQVVFSCPLAGSQKTVSMCVAGDVAHGAGRFYYAYGREGKPELTYPAAGSEGEFTRTHLTFAGNTGGYAYAFTNAGFKYVIYSVSGSNNLQDGGLVVLKDGQAKPVKQSTCQSGKVTDTDDDALIDATLKWKSDPAIDKNGIPTR